jgi:hypothetical protein
LWPGPSYCVPLLRCTRVRADECMPAHLRTSHRVTFHFVPYPCITTRVQHHMYLMLQISSNGTIGQIRRASEPEKPAHPLNTITEVRHDIWHRIKHTGHKPCQHYMTRYTPAVCASLHDVSPSRPCTICAMVCDYTYICQTTTDTQADARAHKVITIGSACKVLFTYRDEKFDSSHLSCHFRVCVMS